MKKAAVNAFALCSALLMSMGYGTASAQQVVQGNLKVTGTVSADAMQTNGGTVLTAKDVPAIQSQVLKQVAEELTNRLRTDGNSTEMRFFSEQVTNAIAKTIGVTKQELSILRRDLNESNKAGVASINEMRAAISNMQRAQVAADREIASLRRELEQLRRDLSRR